MAAQLFELFLSLEMGAAVYFADRNALKGSLSKTLVEVRPTCMFGVPRIYEKIQERYMSTDTKGPNWIWMYITNLARTVMLQHHLDQMAGYVVPCLL